MGSYGLISYYTAQRTREIGIRMALGATPLKVFRLVLKEGMSLVSIGLALGLIFGYGFGKSLANLLYATSPRGPRFVRGRRCGFWRGRIRGLLHSRAARYPRGPYGGAPRGITHFAFRNVPKNKSAGRRR